MRQDIQLMTVATRDLDAARDFYVGAMGWNALMDVPGEIIFFQIGPGLVLGFFDAEKFNRDIATGQDHSRVSGVTLSQNLQSRIEVAGLVERMKGAGALVLKAPQESAFGGVFNAHVQDPNGLIWEIAHNPQWEVDEHGRVTLG